MAQGAVSKAAAARHCGFDSRPRHEMKIIMSVLFAATLGCGGAQSSAPPTASAPAALKTADPADSPTDEMRAHFERGQDEYEKKKYQEAEDSFMAAYAIKPAPSLLYNVAVCREKRGDNAGAAEMFQRYLAESPSASDRTAVEERIRTLAPAPTPYP